MRNFNWETLPKHSVLGKHNIWTADQPDGEYELDTEHMEELFSKKQAQANNLNRQSIKGLPSAKADVVSILNSKRSMNVGIFLKQFRRPVREMVDDIKVGNYLSFGTGKLRELCKMLPDKDEVKQLRNFKGDHFSLPDADLFMLMLVKIPSYEDRLNSLVLKEEFFPLMEELKGFVGTLITAGKELLESDQLHSVIRLVLKTGNYMNAGGYAGSAIGFRMKSLLKLVDTKANKPGMNLMHYVVIQAQKVDAALLEFPEQLQHIEAAARLNQADIEAEFARQLKNVRDAKEDSVKQEDLKKQMEDFLEEAEVSLRDLEADLQELSSLSDSVAEYFCEEPGAFKLEECCSIFHSFCERFMKAIQENKTREVSEAKRRHAERLQTALKRRSIASCSARDKELGDVSLESVLQGFVSKRGIRRKSGRPFSTHGTPPSNSPLADSLPEISSGANVPNTSPNRSPYLKLKQMGKKEWNSAAELTNTEKNQTLTTLDTPSVDIPDIPDIPIKDLQTDSPNCTKSLSSTSRPNSGIETADVNFEDNTVEEAQTLREASKKILKFQKNRGSASSMDSTLGNSRTPIQRQRTIDEDLQSYMDEPKDKDLEILLASPSSPSKRNLGRRHTLPPKVPKTEEIEDGCTLSPPRTPNVAKKGHSDVPQNETCEKNLKVPPLTLTENALEDENQDFKAIEQSDTNSPKSAKMKTEPGGLLFNFLKRFQFPTAKEGTRKSSDSSV